MKKNEEKILEIIGEWKCKAESTANMRGEKAAAGIDPSYNRGVGDGISSAVNNLTKELKKAGFIDSKSGGEVGK